MAVKSKCSGNRKALRRALKFVENKDSARSVRLERSRAKSIESLMIEEFLDGTNLFDESPIKIVESEDSLNESHIETVETEDSIVNSVEGMAREEISLVQNDLTDVSTIGVSFSVRFLLTV